MRKPAFDFITSGGGIDVTTPALEVKPGRALTLVNFEPELPSGYRRINGYERVDGRAAPSSAVYYTVEVADASGISVGATLTGGTSGATSYVHIKSGNTLGVTALTGTYTLSEAANGTTITAIEALRGQADVDIDNTWQLSAEDYYRSLITALPGSGDTLGAVRYKTLRYAFRSNGTNAIMYKSSASGWTAVTFFHYIFFDAGVGADGDLAPGVVIDGGTSSAQGTIKKVIKNGGAWGSTASGYLVIDVTTGTFQDNEALQVSAVTKATSDGANVAITLQPGGKFQFIEHNFYGSSGTEYLYGCDGVNPAWEFDGTVLSPIFFPAPDENPSWNTPKYLAAHDTNLFLSFPGGQMASSSLGEPLVFSALLGAVDFGLGAECTGLESRAGQVLAIYTDVGRTYGLYGTSGNWTLRTISESFGAKDYTVKSMGTVWAVDDKGIVPMERVQAYGDFEAATVSRSVRPILETYKDAIVQSVIVKARNQYRVFFNDGVALVMSDDRLVSGASQSFSTIKYPDIPTCIWNSDDENGNEEILFGDSSGMVYQAEKGYNFDGDEIEYAYRTPFTHGRSPQTVKSYRRVFTNIEAEREIPGMKIKWDLSYGSTYKAINQSVTPQINGGGGYYDEDNWDEIYWDAELFSSGGNRLAGSGINISFLYYGKSKVTRPFTIQSIELEHLPRRSKRAVRG
jgi:hypothetical protein